MQAATPSHPARSPKSDFNIRGFSIVPGVVPHTDCDSLTAELTTLFQQHQESSRTRIGGVRNLLRISDRVSQLATSPRLIPILEELVGASVFPVRAIFFDKTAESNWRVPWHQDLTIALKERIDTPGFGPWSIKEGVPHVQPTIEILDRMCAVRLHLDDCDANNGALRVIAGSHLNGELSAEQIGELVRAKAEFTCIAARGDTLIMRPLLLHASSPAQSPSHRRVLHIEYACDELPNGLEWFDR